MIWWRFIILMLIWPNIWMHLYGSCSSFLHRHSHQCYEERLLDHPGWAEPRSHRRAGSSKQTPWWQQGTLCSWDARSNQGPPWIYAVCHPESPWPLWWQKGITAGPRRFCVVVRKLAVWTLIGARMVYEKSLGLIGKNLRHLVLSVKWLIRIKRLYQDKDQTFTPKRWHFSTILRLYREWEYLNPIINYRNRQMSQNLYTMITRQLFFKCVILFMHQLKIKTADASRFNYRNAFKEPTASYRWRKIPKLIFTTLQYNYLECARTTGKRLHSLDWITHLVKSTQQLSFKSLVNYLQPFQTAVAQIVPPN